MSKRLSVLSLVVILALIQSGLAPTEVSSIPMGACCYSDGSCSDNLTQAECLGQGGTYMGDGTSCFGVECIPQPQGACCYSDGSCSDNLTQAECLGQGGTYMGDETSCFGVECIPQPQGACCYSDGSCSDNLTQAECLEQGGTYMGDATNCSGVECSNDVKDETGGREKQSAFTLFQNYPNPFNQTTKIEFTLAKSRSVSLSIYDLLGRKVRTFASEHLPSGYKSVFWDGKNDSGKMSLQDFTFTRLKLEILLRPKSWCS